MRYHTEGDGTRYRRPEACDVDRDDADLWCVEVAGEECDPAAVQCPECGHMPDGDEDPHRVDMRRLAWSCGGCGEHLDVVPRSEECSEDDADDGDGLRDL